MAEHGNGNVRSPVRDTHLFYFRAAFSETFSATFSATFIALLVRFLVRLLVPLEVPLLVLLLVREKMQGVTSRTSIPA